MNPYKTPMPRTVFGMAACALTVGTFALLVVGPASFIAQGEQGVRTALSPSPSLHAARIAGSISTSNAQVMNIV